MATAMVVDSKGVPQQVEALRMRSDNRDIPTAVGDEAEVGAWIIGVCSFDGTVQRGDDEEQVTASAPAAIAVAGARVIGILSPNGKSDPAIWWSTDIADAKVTSAGSQGMFKKRPSSVLLATSEWTVNFSEVAQLFRKSHRMQSGQEASLLEALGGQ